MIKRTLYFENPAYLSLKNQQLVVKYPTVENEVENTKTVPIEDIGIVILANQQITITHGAIAALLDNNCAVVTCNNRNFMPQGLLLNLEGNTLQSERFTAQIKASQPLKKQLWQQTIQAKIINQANILQTIQKQEVKNMLKWANDVRSGDSSNLEGRAAAYYWKNIFPSLKNFVRGADEEPPNNLLNYGYAILRAVIARALVGSGLLPTLGIHHHNRYNAYCLADDIMEPYRPFVDKLVVKIVDSGVDFQELSKEIKTKLLQIPVLDVMINGQRSPLMLAAGQTSASLARCYLKEIRKIVYPSFEQP